MAGHERHSRWRSALERWLPAPAARRERRPGEALAEATREPSASETLNTRVLEAVPDGICLSRDGLVVYGNVALANLVGLSDPAEAVGRPTLDFVDFDFHEGVKRGRVDAVENVLYGPTEIRLRRVDGTLIPAELRVVAIDHDAGCDFLNVIRDLTAQKEAEAEAELRATALEQSTDGVLIADERGLIVYVNRAFCEMRNAEPGDFIGQSAATDLGILRNPEVDAPGVVEDLLAGGTWRGRYRVEVDGETYHHDTRCFAVRGPSGGIHSLVALVRDITSDVRLEQQAEQGRRMEAVEQLAGGIAHDVNNLLTLILGHVELLAIESPNDPAVQQHAKAIAAATERSASIGRQLLAFGRRRALEPRVVDVTTVVNDGRGLLAELVPETVSLQFDLAPSIPPVRVDPNALGRALTELVMNAKEAIGGEGKIRVATHRGEGVVVLEVEDDGCGMDERTRERMFEPFFSTRDPGEGEGLGLATIHGFVVQSGGRIEVDSQPGRGTRVRILLPEAPRSFLAPTEPPGVRSEGAEGGETLLLIEDDEGLRALSHRCLREAGYRVIEAADGLEAIRLATAHTGTIDLIVCDVLLPGIDGLELASRLRRTRPRLRVLLMSGYAPETEGATHFSDLRAQFLQKPFRMADLVACVREMLDAPPPTADGG